MRWLVKDEQVAGKNSHSERWNSMVEGPEWEGTLTFWEMEEQRVKRRKRHKIRLLKLLKGCHCVCMYMSVYSQWAGSLKISPIWKNISMLSRMDLSLVGQSGCRVE